MTLQTQMIGSCVEWRCAEQYVGETRGSWIFVCPFDGYNVCASPDPARAFARVEEEVGGIKKQAGIAGRCAVPTKGKGRARMHGVRID